MYSLNLNNGIAIFAVAQTILASLRASTRVLLMLHRGMHDDQGPVMEGPLIEPPANENETATALWELSDAFRHSVLLALQRDDFDVQYEINDLVLPGARLLRPSVLDEDNINYNIRQYSLSPLRDSSSSPYDEDEEEDEEDEEEEEDGAAAGEEYAGVDFLRQKVDSFGERHYYTRMKSPKKQVTPAFLQKKTPFLSGGMMVDIKKKKNKKNGKDNTDTNKVVPWGTSSSSISSRTGQVAVAEKEEQRQQQDDDYDLDADIIYSQEGEESAALASSSMGDPMESDFYLTLSTVKLIGNVYQQQSMPSSSSAKSATTTSAQQNPPPRVAQLTAYAPEGFAQLRSLHGISEREFRKSILESGPYVSFSSNSKGAARAGGVFFFTRDGKYLIKTIKQDEVPTLLSMLPKYFRFMQRNAKRSLLTRYCGMYEVTFRDRASGDEKPYTFVVMNSVFPVQAASSLSERYDLKGSTVGRECSIAERESKGRRAVLQDLDLAREVDLVKSLQKRGRYTKSHGYGIDLGTDAKAALMTQLRRDVDFLVACNVMDYSLLVGVEPNEPFHAGLDAASSDLHLITNKGPDGQPRMQSAGKGSAAPAAAAATAAVASSNQRAKNNNPVHLILSLAKKILSVPDPYHDGSVDGLVDAGPLAAIPGYRMGNPATYYFGLIDFLQPFNTKKAVEYRLKSVMYEPTSFSCIPPKEYGERFLAFLNDHII